MAPLKTPIPSPAPGCKPQPRDVLTPEQQQKYDWLLSQARSWTDVPSTSGKNGPLTDSERFWLTRDCLLRYLRATKWHERDAEKRVLETLAWRRDYGVEELTPEYISIENETGKQIILGYDREGRVCHYLNPGRQNTDASPRQVQHLVYMVERVIDLMPAGQETLALLINFKQSKTRSNTTPGMSLAREVLHILQHHYPERLGRALIINMPWFVTTFFKLITPFIDPRTREKLKFNEDMSQYVPPEQMWNEFSTGMLEFEYEHAVYWPALHELCRKRRQERWERWVKGGKVIGESEDFLAGGVDVSVNGVNVAASTEEKKAETAAAEPEKKKTEEQKPAEKPAETPAPPPTADAAPVDSAIAEKMAELKVEEVNAPQNAATVPAN
ncbi:putative phosphatidylinositol transporter protein [Thermochaetoides thermophila DSM 1495]|uniref:Putative phosphatidylinositol transporter protein n=1 Tax=Chaetomium thermophilum (strain DSM 1495 / CBS 144.50 / IMI 039719) TaxID=759272 RepID=G0SHD5_CHATD|nr:putative phosphatidylinositol transporter protein [Thermochaetoides thermophila DSM 1495]EGS17624.1 putative phosphatidylinositol transporter protein [Thermochaetoides thermophila DSM 1495]